MLYCKRHLLKPALKPRVWVAVSQVTFPRRAEQAAPTIIYKSWMQTVGREGQRWDASRHQCCHSLREQGRELEILHRIKPQLELPPRSLHSLQVPPPMAVPCSPGGISPYFLQSPGVGAHGTEGLCFPRAPAPLGARRRQPKPRPTPAQNTRTVSASQQLLRG